MAAPLWCSACCRDQHFMAAFGEKHHAYPQLWWYRPKWLAGLRVILHIWLCLNLFDWILLQRFVVISGGVPVSINTQFLLRYFLKHIREADVSAVQCSALYCCQKPHVRRILGKRAGAWSSRHARMPCVECVQRLLGWQGISPCYLCQFFHGQATDKPLTSQWKNWTTGKVAGRARARTSTTGA